MIKRMEKDQMKALLILAHGSRKNESNQEILDLGRRLEDISNNGFDKVQCAFVQFTTPLFHTQVDALVAQGITTIVVLPYFIAAGSHVLSDIPLLIDQAKARHMRVDFKLTPHFGKFHGIEKLILSEVAKFG